MHRIVAVTLVSATIAGCASVPGAPPITTYAANDCASAPHLDGALSLIPEKDKRAFTVSAPVGSMSPCLRNGPEETPYILFAIPLETNVKMIEVGAQMEALRIFSPAVAILDESGNQLRSFTPDQYLYRGPVFSVQFSPQRGERFILVTADPARIGQSYDAIALSTSSTPIVSPYFVSNWTSGIDQNISRTFSYEGSVMAIVHSVEPGDG